MIKNYTLLEAEKKCFGMQTYQTYLETMQAYNFYPTSIEEWINAQMDLHGFIKFKSIKTDAINCQ